MQGQTSDADGLSSYFARLPYKSLSDPKEYLTTTQYIKGALGIYTMCLYSMMGHELLQHLLPPRAAYSHTKH